MSLFDFIRFVAIGGFGIGTGYMLVTNYIAFRVLRPPKKLGFLWWHVTSISLSIICYGVVAVEAVAGRLGDPPTWRSAVVLVGSALYAVAQFIIFNVERQRLVHAQARRVNEAASGDG